MFFTDASDMAQMFVGTIRRPDGNMMTLGQVPLESGVHVFAGSAR
jgi:hypothetical protein